MPSLGYVYACSSTHAGVVAQIKNMSRPWCTSPATAIASAGDVEQLCPNCHIWLVRRTATKVGTRYTVLWNIPDAWPADRVRRDY